MILGKLERWIFRPVLENGDDRLRRKFMFLNIFLVLSLVLIAILTLIYAIGAIPGVDWHLSIDVGVNAIILVFLAALFWLNRRGFTQPASYGYIVGFMVTIAFFVPRDWLTHVYIFFIAPIQISSFLIQPRASIFLAIFSAGAMLILDPDFLLDPSGMVAVFICSMFLAALASWFISERLEKALDEARRSEKKYLSLLENGPYCMYLSQGNQLGSWEYVNPQIYDLLGFTAGEWLAAPDSWKRQLHSDDRQRVMEEIDQSRAQNRPFRAEYRLLHRSGDVVWVRDETTLNRHSEPESQVQGVLVDITARKRAEQVQQATYRIAQAAFSAGDLGDLYRQIHAVLGELMHVENFFIALYHPNTGMLSFPYFVDQYDEPPEPVIARHGLTEYVLRTGKALLATRVKCVELIAQGEISDMGTPSVDWLGVPLIINNRPIGVMAVQSYTEGIRFSDEELEILTFVSNQVAMVIDRKRTESELREVNQLTGEVISGVNTGIIVYDQDTRHLIWNRYMEQMTGLTMDQVIGKTAREVFPMFSQANLLAFYLQTVASETLTIPDLEYQVPLTGKSGWFSGYFGPHRDAEGKRIGAIAVINDITERKTAEQALRSALREKEVLLREIHHRVKNNLQVMSSLISLQAETVQNVEVRGSFHEMQARVRSMALIHEELYQAQDLARVNFAEYVNKLAAGLSRAFEVNPNVAMHVQVDDIPLGVDTAIPLGLIINEIVTNAYKYAFPDGRRGEVCISLATRAANEYSLVIRDNGIGLPPGIDIENTATLGMQLITILVRQLRASLSLSVDQGTCYQIDFSETLAAQRGP